MTIPTRISADELRALTAAEPEPVSAALPGRSGARPRVVILDTGVLLPSAEFDGDYRSTPGLDGWRARSIPGSRYLDLTTELRRPGSLAHFPVPTAEAVAELLARLGVGDTTEIVLYDNRGDIWAARLWWTLASFGIASRVLLGGVSAWEAAGYPVVPGVEPGAAGSGAAGSGAALTAPHSPSHTPSHPAVPVALDGFWASQDDVIDIVAGRRPAALVCALDPATFAGTRPTRYSRRGHIPGSINLPARGIVDAADSFPDGDVVVYCGGGISACLVAFAFAEAGRFVAVYSGSIEEWSAAAVLPMESGYPPSLSPAAAPARRG